jgi:hypothetical protein
MFSDSGMPKFSKWRVDGAGSKLWDQHSRPARFDGAAPLRPASLRKNVRATEASASSGEVMHANEPIAS